MSALYHARFRGIPLLKHFLLLTDTANNISSNHWRHNTISITNGDSQIIFISWTPWTSDSDFTTRGWIVSRFLWCNGADDGGLCLAVCVTARAAATRGRDIIDGDNNLKKKTSWWNLFLKFPKKHHKDSYTLESLITQKMTCHYTPSQWW